MQTQTDHPLEIEFAKFVAINPSHEFCTRVFCRFIAELKASPIDGAELAECFANAVKSLES